MAAAVAAARDEAGRPRFHVIGLDLPTPEGQKRIDALNQGRFPFETADAALAAAVLRGRETGNLIATSDSAVYGLASVVVVDIHLDVQGAGREATVDFTGFRKAVATVGAHARPGCLVVVETTVPPGTCSKVVVPELAAALKRRGLPEDCLPVAHSYERVMPGDGYFDSIVNYWRVYSGHDERAAEACEAFLSTVINTRDYPLTRLPHTVASETAKVLENSYRATTIAFMEEWGRFAEAAGFDLFKVVDAIRMRPTHSNMRTPGFGVGGYCLTKDPLLPLIGARELLGRGDLDFPFCRQAIEVNRAMPLVSADRLSTLLGGVAGRRVLLMGVSYRPGVADTRYSPSQTFVERLRRDGAKLLSQDPLVGFWEELGEEVPVELPAAAGLDAVVLAVPHPQYRDLDFAGWLGDSRPLVLDASGVLTDAQRRQLRGLGCRVESIGRGEGL
jgi:nucleotide sugar dehydrogenase